eukprot:15265089-Alexandrium_andersonii.AAC.1
MSSATRAALNIRQVAHCTLLGGIRLPETASKCTLRLWAVSGSFKQLQACRLPPSAFKRVQP